MEINGDGIERNRGGNKNDEGLLGVDGLSTSEGNCGRWIRARAESKRTRCIIKTGVGGKVWKIWKGGRFVARACQVWSAHATEFSKECRCRNNKQKERISKGVARAGFRQPADRRMDGWMDILPRRDSTVPAGRCRNFVPACWAPRTEIRTLSNVLYHVQSAEWNAQATLFDVPGARRGCCDSASETPRCRCLSWRSMGHERRDRIGFP